MTRLSTLFVLVIVAVVVTTAMAGRRFPVFSAHSETSLPPFKTFWFQQYVDHFNFATQPQKYAQRYLVTDTYWSGQPNAPILFYSGNEGDIMMFYNNTGFIFELADMFGALVVFAEHRFYGESLPFGDQSFTPQNLALCTVEQALADYAVLLTDLKKKDPLLGNSPVITVGGSYGGMLSSWFRIKYPHIVEGALAASAPILQFHGVRSDYIFSQICTQDYASVSPVCSTRIQKAFQMIASLGKQGQYSKLTSAFRTCKPIQSASDVDALTNWVITAFMYMAMTDYPYPTNFLQPLPAWPVKASCQPIISGSATDILSAVAQGAGVYYNTSGSASCFDIWNAEVSPSLGNAWNYQACTELNLNTAANGVTDFFPPDPFDEKEIAASCMQQFGVTPRDDWIMTWYGGINITQSSNIIFSNGKLDPWSGGGVLQSLSDSLIAIVIDDAAHHLDLRFSDPRDPPAVVAARKQEAAIITSWLWQYYARKELTSPLKM